MNDDQMFCEFIFLIFHEQRIQDIKLLYNRCTVQRAFSLEITTSANSLTEWLYHLRHHHCYHVRGSCTYYVYGYIPIYVVTEDSL